MTFANIVNYVRRVGVSQAIRTLRMTNEFKIGALKGEDANGNRYFESLDEQAGRTRWVKYANTSYYDASQVTPEWHPWLHYMTDKTPIEMKVSHRDWEMPYEDNKTFTSEAYYPPGHHLSRTPEMPRVYETWSDKTKKEG
uniref:NADH dehydrogenase [ubiquinone] 1 alpha subcomplex subunit 12 n=1 Tax=Spongospora subterranea TaxID=70186 RepID=A0A0H5R4F1_9EUKA|eukprot:CRZ02919.1 hypothetical protein [Spongospora subterranea]